MRDDDDLDFDDFDSGHDEAPVRRRKGGPSPDAPLALIVEGDPATARICSDAATRLGMRPQVVWTRGDALAALAKAPAFVYADARILGRDVAGAAAEIRALVPVAPFVAGTRVLDDVLVADVVALCKPFDADQFEAAFDAALTEDAARARRVEAAAQVRAVEAADAVAAEIEAFEPTPAPQTSLSLSA